MSVFKQWITLLLCTFLLTIAASAQLTKFQKWNEPSYFRGFNIKLWDNVNNRTVNQQDYYDLKATGANLAIMQIWGSRSDTAPYAPTLWWTNGIDTSYYISKLDSMVKYAQNAGIYYVICIRQGPGRRDVGWSNPLPNTLWQDTVEQNEYAGMLKDMAQRYLPDSLFVGIDMIQEPNPGNPSWSGIEVNRYEDSMQFYNIDINGLYTKCIDSIRTVAPGLPLLVQGVHWSNAEYFGMTTKQADNKIVYNVHTYIPRPFAAHDSLNDVNMHYPDTFWNNRLEKYGYMDKEYIRDTLLFVVDSFKNANNVPILIGEFGLAIPQNDGITYLMDMADIFCEEGYHYAYWIFGGEPTYNYQYFDDSIMGGATAYMDSVIESFNCRDSMISSIEYVSHSNISIYPNPAGEYFNIILDKPFKGTLRVKIYDILGKEIGMIMEPTISERNKEISVNISQLSPGIYFVSCENNRSAFRETLVVIK